MSTLSGIMNTSLSALQTYQVAIDVTGSNIANANTDGYSRQTVDINTTQTLSSSYGYLGTGVEASEVKRVSDAYVLKQLNSAAGESGELEVDLKYLESVEAVLDESEGSGLNEALGEFFCAWQDLANDPTGSTERSILVSEAEALTVVFNDMYSDLQEVREGIDDDIAAMVEEINGISEQIADLNRQILQAENSNQDTNTLKDSLDSLVTKLSALVEIGTYESESGQINVQLADGSPLVSGSQSWSLGTETNSTTGLQDVTWVDTAGNARVITEGLTGGKVGGALEVRDEVIPEYLDNLDELASEIMEQVNTLHTSGYDINGDAGGSLFTGTGAGDMAVNQDIIDDPGLLAAAETSDGAPGDSSNAIAIAALQKSTLMDGGTTTFEEYYSSLVSAIGTLVENTESSHEYQSGMVDFYNNYRESISGVSLDEETANLVLYQMAYEAAAKVISVLDEILETVLNM